MPTATYDIWRGELRLADPTRVELDGAVADVCRSFAQLADDVRNDVRRTISLDEFYTLLTFSRRAAVFALRGVQSDLVDGMTAISMIEAERVDFRDIVVALGLLHHAGIRVGQDVSRLWEETAARSEPRVADLINGLLARSRTDQDIRNLCGLVEVETDNGGGFVGWGFRPYRPTCDLLRTSLGIARLMEAGAYEPDDPELATELPKVWFRGEPKPPVTEILEDVVAGATVNCRLRPSVLPTHANQQLTMFLVELPDALQALDLARASERPTDGFARLGVATGRLFCLVVARSFVQGVESYETVETLARLRPGIAQVLAQFGAGPGDNRR